MSNDKSTGHQPSQQDLEKLQERVKELEQQLTEHLDGWKRAKADYQNLQKDQMKERERTIKFANEQLIQQLLPMVDYFQYAFQGIPSEQQNSSWVQGVRHIYDQLLAFLQANGVMMMETIGKPFDPSLHESVEEVSAPDATPGTIVEQVAPGFLLHGVCIRPAKVKIAI